MAPGAPNLHKHPQKFNDSCLTISTLLLEQIHRRLPTTSCTVLSIGCGTGFLEQQLQQAYKDLAVEGVEVRLSSTIPQHLSEGSMHTVSGTWDLSSRASEAEAWMFVYPRESRLVDRYIDQYSLGGVVHVVIWLGPVVDWPDYAVVFEKAEKSGLWGEVKILEGDAAGLALYEMMAVMQRLPKAELESRSAMPSVVEPAS